MVRASLVVAVVIAVVGVSRAIADEAVAPAFTSRPILVKTNDGAVVAYQLDRQARRTAVSIAGLEATVHLTGPPSNSVYDAFVESGALRAGHLYWVCIRVVSRSGGVADRVERLYLHRRFPRG